MLPRTSPFSSVKPAGLTVGGYNCPQSGQIAYSNIPPDNRYFITMFGGGSDAQGVACPGNPIADGTWYYIADKDRFGCNTHVQITNPDTGVSVVAAAVDVGPNVCVEQAAGGPVIDASPLVIQALFGVNSYGWEDRKPVLAVAVDSSVPLGPSGTVDVNSINGSYTALAIGTAVAVAVSVGGYFLWDAYANGRFGALAKR